jgi:hypothetical protein
MSGLFRRLSSRRSEGPEGAPAESGAAEAPANAPAEPGGHESLLVDPAAQTRVLREGETPAPAPESAAAPPAAEDPATTVHPVVRLQAAPQPEPPYAAPPAAEGPVFPVSDLPAGVDPDELAAAPPTSARRSRLRRRVSFLRAAREVLLRDLGGFVYELHRTAGDIEHEAHRRLREVKLARLTRVDTELHELELRLDDVRRHVVVREPGVGGECPNCGELFGSDAHYCAHCGLPLTESARRAVAREAPAPEPVATAPEPQPGADQPTEEYSTLGHEFDWPTRAADPHEQPTHVVPGAGGEARPDEAVGAETPAAEPEAVREDDAGATGRGEPEAPRGDAGETPASEPQAAAEEIAASEPQAAREDDAGAAAGRESGDETPGGESQAAGGETATGEPGVTADGESEAAGDVAAGQTAEGEPGAPGDVGGGEDGGEPRADVGEAAGGEPRAAGGEAPGGEPEAGAEGADPASGGAWHDSPGDAYSPLERRR